LAPGTWRKGRSKYVRQKKTRKNRFSPAQVRLSLTLIWLTDFGLAHLPGDQRLTMTGDLLGTLRYMSPEQALAQRVAIDHRTDIYSLGVTLYELLTLQPAYAGQDRQELLSQIAFKEPRPLRKLDRAIPAELETIVLKAMEKAPGDRYSTAGVGRRPAPPPRR